MRSSGLNAPQRFSVHGTRHAYAAPHGNCPAFRDISVLFQLHPEAQMPLLEPQPLVEAMRVQPGRVGRQLRSVETLAAGFFQAMIDHHRADTATAHVGARLYRLDHHGLCPSPDELGQDRRLEGADHLTIQFRHIERFARRCLDGAEGRKIIRLR